MGIDSATLKAAVSDHKLVSESKKSDKVKVDSVLMKPDNEKVANLPKKAEKNKLESKTPLENTTESTHLKESTKDTLQSKPVKSEMHDNPQTCYTKSQPKDLLESPPIKAASHKENDKREGSKFNEIRKASPAKVVSNIPPAIRTLIPSPPASPRKIAVPTSLKLNKKVSGQWKVTILTPPASPVMTGTKTNLAVEASKQITPKAQPQQQPKQIRIVTSSNTSVADELCKDQTGSVNTHVPFNLS
jgi:hypothetical protein